MVPIAWAAFERWRQATGQATMNWRIFVLRHTFASHFIMNGGNLLTLQKILGHQSIQMTMRYAHLAPDHLNDAVKLNPLNQSGHFVDTQSSVNISGVYQERGLAL